MPEILLKPTLRCNAACVYCHVDAESVGVDVMPEEVLESVFRRMDEYLQANPEKKFSFIWHGGEALLLPPRYFHRALELQDRLCARTKSRISHGIQSNLTLVQQGHLDALRALGVNLISTSYEPIAGIRGLRANGGVDSASYNKAFLNGLRLLRTNAFRYAIIYVVNRESLSRPLDVYRFLLNLTGGAFKLNPIEVFTGRCSDLRVSAEEYADFLGTIFAVWWPERARYPQVGPFEDFASTMLDGAPAGNCSNSGGCADSMILVAPDGSTSICCDSADLGLASFGNIADRSIEEIFRAPLRLAIRKRNAALPQAECKGCRFWRLCHGGCPIVALHSRGSFLRENEKCSFIKRFVERHFEPVTGARYAGCAESAQA